MWHNFKFDGKKYFFNKLKSLPKQTISRNRENFGNQCEKTVQLGLTCFENGFGFVDFSKTSFITVIVRFVKGTYFGIGKVTRHILCLEAKANRLSFLRKIWQKCIKIPTTWHEYKVSTRNRNIEHNTRKNKIMYVQFWNEQYRNTIVA